jgi:acetyl-CoA carboxylase biotin carboxyl carrier protein
MATKRKQGSRDGGRAFTMQEVKTLVEVVQGSDVTSLVWTRADHKLAIRRGQVAPVAGGTLAAAAPAAVAPVPHPAPAAAPPAPVPTRSEKPGSLVTSPFVGTFYRAPSPDSQPYVEVGAAVKKGQVLCIVEAMKLMNEIESEVEGKVAEILAQNATPVEFGQPLFRIEPL